MDNILSSLTLISGIVWLICLFVCYTYYLQLNRYEVVATLKISGVFCLKFFIVCVLFVIVDVMVCYVSNVYASLTASLLLCLFKVAYSILQLKRLQKKGRLRFTNRVLRQLFFDIVCYCVVMLFCFKFDVLCLSFLGVFLSYIVSLYISKLIEYVFAIRYIYATKRKLKKYKNLKVIGITGSYGKTSTKIILTKILQSQYVVKCTPKSFNTPMGICKYVLSESFDNVDFLVVEMGAVRIGDIRKLCKIVSPKYGILTSIGTQHLETFKSLDNIVKTKNELAQYVFDNNGYMFYNGLNDKCFQLFNNAVKGNKYIIIDNNDVNNDNNDVKYANNVNMVNVLNISKYGTYFKYIETHTDTVVYLSTVLLGVASVINISLSIMVARFLGIEFKKIEQVVLSLPYINNRLELRIAKGGASVIYDAYNSNENSFAEMLKMVALFDVGYKILITPGVVELGASQYSVNVKISKLASDVFDEIWVINRVNKYAFIEGVKGSKCIVNYYDHLDVKIFEKVNMFDEKVLVVFENDLPDIYK